MKQYAALSLIILLTIATPAFAAPNENKSNNGKSNGNKEDNSGKKAEVKEVQALEVTIVPSGEPTISATPSQAVTPSVTWKNHGEYVSSVAKTHPGGQVVSAAARSDVGKKNKNKPSPAPTISATPSAVPSISIVPSVSVVPSTSPSGEPTPSVPPITSAQEAGTFQNPIDAVITFFQNAVNFFTNLKVT